MQDTLPTELGAGTAWRQQESAGAGPGAGNEFPPGALLQGDPVLGLLCWSPPRPALLTGGPGGGLRVGASFEEGHRDVRVAAAVAKR